MKISINNACNSKCPYCFAGTMGIKQGSEMSLENFKKILDWMVINNDHFICLLGGEPTVNSHFREFMSLINEYSTIYNWEFLLLTNGVLLDEFLDTIISRTAMLININSPKALGNKQYEHLTSSMKALKELNLRGFKTNQYTLGCNLHAEEIDYSYFWKIVDLTKATCLRVSVASPQNNKYIQDRDSYFKLMKKRFMNFINEANKRNCRVILDCSQIPICYFNGKEIWKISQATKEAFDRLCGCKDVIFQALPDMTLSCCFGDSDFDGEKVFLDFNKPFDYYETLFEEKRKERRFNNYIKKCSNCEFKEKGICFAGCFGFKDSLKYE